MEFNFQKLLWNIAGAEISILEKCRTDYKKFSAIGATILMTAFIAFCAGTSAAWYFTQNGTDTSGNIGWAMLFGLIWAILIFCIDRSLVITLKKNPTIKRQKFLIPLLSRSLLALVIAFMVSIPLELMIFEDYIAANGENFSANQIAVLGEKIRINNGEDRMNGRISRADTTLKSLDTEADSLQEQIKTLQTQIDNLEDEKIRPNSLEYNTAKNNYNNASRAYDEAQKNYNTENGKEYPSNSTLSYYQRRVSEAKASMSSASRSMAQAKKIWSEDKQSKIDKLVARLEEKKIEKEKKDELYRKTLDSQLKDKEAAQLAEKERKEKEINKQNQLDKGNHFIQNFQILEYAVWQRDKDGNLTDKTQLMFLWLVRLLFFIIEILPTIVKIVTPVGSYDRMVRKEEDELNNYLQSSSFSDGLRQINEMDLHFQEEHIRMKKEAELEIKKEILKKMQETQMRIADAAIEKWEKDQITKIADGSTIGNAPSIHTTKPISV